MFVGNTFFMSSEEFPAIQEVIKMFGMPVDKLPGCDAGPGESSGCRCLFERS